MSDDKSTNVSNTEVKENSQEKKEIKTEEQFKQKEIDKKSFCYVPTLIKTNTHNAPYPI